MQNTDIKGRNINRKHTLKIYKVQKVYIYISGGPLSALTCCVNVRLLSAIKKISPLIYSQSWNRLTNWNRIGLGAGSILRTMMTFTLIF